jgi:hypothetical protein
VSAELFLPAQQPLTLNALVDSSASARGFIDRSLVKLKNIRTYKTSYTRIFILADNRAAIEKITDYIIVPLKIGNYNENALFFVIKLLQQTFMILGLPWLWRYNPCMNFRNTTLTFTLDYCKKNCLVPGLSNAAPMVQAPTKDFHDLPVPDEPSTTTPATILETKYSRSVYRKCTAKDENKQAPPNQGTKDLYIPITLSPGTNPFCTRQIGGNPNSRAMMIATSLANRPVPTSILAG